MVVLSTLDVTKRFKIPGQKPIEVLKGVSFSVREGEKVAIVGRSGAGKSTLLNILGGLLKPTSGTVSRPKNFGFVFQSYHLMPELTVLENVLLPTMSRRAAALATRAASEARARDLIEKVGLGKRLDHLPAELSGGERQRVALARALANNPKIIIADEPTGNIDPKMSLEIMSLLMKINKLGKTVIVVTHEKNLVDYYKQRVVMLKDGLIVEDHVGGMFQ